MAETDLQETIRKPGVPKPYPLATWLKLKTDYVHGKGSLADLARMAGVTVDQAHKRSAREGWRADRTDWFEQQQKRLDRERQEQDRQTQPQPVPEQPRDGTRAGTVLQQIDQIDKAIAVAMPSDLPKLADAKAKLWALLYPKPGTIRPKRGRPSQPEPIEPTPAPEPEPDQSQP
jgi:hypothetical protein